METLTLLDSLINTIDSCNKYNSIDVINIIHFNDVYNINPMIDKDVDGNITCIKGGASRFKSFINILSPLNPIILFSGDFLSPSNMSTATNGEHMIPIMNDIGITCACIGNHELDFGNEHCIDMIAKLKFPVLNTNLLTPTNEYASGDLNTDIKLDLEPLGKCVKSFVYKYCDNFNIGFVGICEDWSFTLPIKPEYGNVYLDFIEECQKSVDELKKHNKIDLMIVLTHSRLPNDKLLASKINGIDLILGGHDHFYYCGMDENTKTLILKTGTDFHNVSWLQLQINDNKSTFDGNTMTKGIEQQLNKSLNEMKGVFNGIKYKFINRHYNIDINIKPDKSTDKLVHDLSDSFQEQINKIVGYIAAPLDVTKSAVRFKESTSGNFVSDVIRRAYHCDGVIINGGALRANRVIPCGPITYKDILDMVPFQDAIVVLKLKGSAIIKILEHSVSGLPKAEGRFPQISGIRFVYDDKADVGKRIKKVWISKYTEMNVDTFGKSLQVLKLENSIYRENEDVFELVEDDTIYKIATRDYLFNGGDGFQSYKNELEEMIIDGEAGIPMSIILRNFFWAIDAVNRLLKLRDDKEKEKRALSIVNRYTLQVSKSTSCSMLRLQSSDIEQKSDKVCDELIVSPYLEHRIMTIDQEIDMESMAFKPLRNFFSKLPSFVNLTDLPRQQSLMQILDDIDQAQSAQKQTLSSNTLQIPLTQLKM